MKKNYPDMEVGLQPNQFRYSFTCSLYKTFPKELSKTAKTFGVANTEIDRWFDKNVAEALPR